MILYPHQQALLDKNPAKHGLFFKMGVGKTITGIALAEKNCKSCLIVCPKMLKPMWEREIKTHGVTCHYSIITKENLRRDAKILPRYDGIIVDEAHFFAGITPSGKASQLHRALLYYLKKHEIKYIWLLTGTPYLSNPFNIYALARLLGHEIDYWSYRKKYFYDVQMGHRIVPKQRTGMEKELASLVRHIGSTIDLDEAVNQAQLNPTFGLPALPNVPDQTFETEYFDLTEEQKKAINELDEPTFITRWTRMHTIENGIQYSDGYTENRVFQCKKTERIVQLCKESPKIAIFCRYNAQIDYLIQHIALAGIITPLFVINGAEKDRDRVIRQVENLPKAIVLIQASCSTGYELPSIPIIVFASLSFSYVDHEQSKGRFLRINKMKSNKYIYLVTEGVDRDVYDCIMRKQDFSLEIYKNHGIV